MNLQYENISNYKRRSSKHFLHLFNFFLNSSKTISELFLTDLKFLDFLFHHFHKIIMVVECSLKLFLKLGHIKFEIPLSFLNSNIKDGIKSCSFIFKVEQSKLIIW